MQLKKRNFPMYMLLNCLSLGVYGFIVSMQIDREINALCKGDNEQPRFGYMMAVLFRGIATIIGLIAGLVVGLVLTKSLVTSVSLFGFSTRIPGAGAMKAAIVLLAILAGGVICTFIGSAISGIYLNYWWYKQANRLKLNANRYGLTVKESGTDVFVFRTLLGVLFIPITVLLFALALLVPGIVIWLITLAKSAGMMVFAAVLLLLVAIPLMLFGMELTVGANFGMFFILKNLNRYADVYRNGATPFDPMAYEYYPSASNKYPNFLPDMIVNKGEEKAGNDDNDKDEDGTDTGILYTGSLIGLNGSCAGYTFDMTPGEELIIGKDAKMAMVVIDPAYKEISRKHVSVCYDDARGQYRVVDYSSNGTWANGEKLTAGRAVYLNRGTELKLANEKNMFRLG